MTFKCRSIPPNECIWVVMIGIHTSDYQDFKEWSFWSYGKTVHFAAPEQVENARYIAQYNVISSFNRRILYVMIWIFCAISVDQHHVPEPRSCWDFSRFTRKNANILAIHSIRDILIIWGPYLYWNWKVSFGLTFRYLCSGRGWLLKWVFPIVPDFPFLYTVGVINRSIGTVKI